MVSMKESSNSKKSLLLISDFGGGSKKSPTMTKKGAFATISYMACAVLLVIFNKAALSSYNFSSANVITLFPMLFSCMFLYALRFWKIISFTSDGTLCLINHPAKLVPPKSIIHTLPLTISYLFYMVISMESIRGINVPIYTALRRTTVAFTMMLEYICWDRNIHHILLAGITCGPILLIWASFSDELETTMNFPYLYSHGFQVVMLLSCVVAFLLNYAVFFNTTVNSTLTLSICGNLKDLFTIGFGWILFGGLPFDLLNIVGQSLGFLGSGICAYCKLKGK